MELTIDRLTKLYGAKLAVDRFEAVLHPGIYGLLGANGAGKTTLMRLICDVQRPTSGDIRLDGESVYKMGGDYRSLLGYLPQDFGYYPEFTAYHFLLYIASLKGLPKTPAKAKALELLDFVGLDGEKNRRIKTFSGGMKQRLGIAQAMLNDPPLLILDEPTAGLDPKERVRFRNLISSFSKNKIVLLSTHIVSDVESIADEILLMKQGRLLLREPPQKAAGHMEGHVWECLVDRGEARRLEETYNVGNLKNQGEKTLLRIVADEPPVPGAVPAQPTLEDLYLYHFDESR